MPWSEILGTLTIGALLMTAPVLAIWRTPRDQVAKRRHVAAVFAVILGYVGAIQIVAHEASWLLQGTEVKWLLTLAGTGLTVVVIRVLAARCQDLQRSRWWAMLAVVPIVSLIVFVLGMTLRSRPADEPT